MMNFEEISDVFKVADACNNYAAKLARQYKFYIFDADGKKFFKRGNFSNANMTARPTRKFKNFCVRSPNTISLVKLFAWELLTVPRSVLFTAKTRRKTMINPTHRLKKFVKYSGDDKADDFYITDAVGWLGSGITDCNGVEIFEGDIVRFGDCNYPVEFRNGALTVDGAPLVMYGNGDDLEVVGHIAEEGET